MPNKHHTCSFSPNIMRELPLAPSLKTTDWGICVFNHCYLLNYVVKIWLNFQSTKINLQLDKTMGIKPGRKRIAKSTGKPDKRQRDNKDTLGNTPSLRPHNHKKGD